MAKAKKLASGSWRCLVYDSTDVNGKRHYESFTASSKKEAEYMAAEFALNKKNKKPQNDVLNITLHEALHQYCSGKSSILSPSTLREYIRMSKKHFTDIENFKINELSEMIIQNWVNRFAATYSPKSTRNAYGLLRAVLTYFRRDDLVKHMSLPQKEKPSLYTPSDKDITVLLASVKGTYLESAICLAAFGPMRRGEICALETTDIFGTTISVTKSMVKGITVEGNRWSIKPPKTAAGYRTIEFPSFVIDILKNNAEGERVVPTTPDYLTNKFIKIITSLDIHRFRFHDLRHYGASILHAIGIPDQYIISRGGWSTDGVMKNIYRSEIKDETKKMNKIISNHFENMQHEMQHKKNNP